MNNPIVQRWNCKLFGRYLQSKFPERKYWNQEGMFSRSEDDSNGYDGLGNVGCHIYYALGSPVLIGCVLQSIGRED